MIKTTMNTYITDLSIQNSDWSDQSLCIPAVHKSIYKQRTDLVNLKRGQIRRLEVDMSPAAAILGHKSQEYKIVAGLDGDLFPYGCPEKTWLAYCLAPHSYRSVGEHKVQVGLNIAGQFLHIDFHDGTAELVDPEIGDQFVSTTNWVDPQTRDLWFGSWSMEDTFRRAAEPDRPVQGSLWKYNFNTDLLAQVWHGETGDSLHQVSLSPDKRYAVICEIGLYGNDALQQKKVHSSKYLILDMVNGQEWDISVPTAAHIEFDPVDPSRIYLSSHNIGLIGGKVGIFGQGKLLAYTLTSDGPVFHGAFTHDTFLRITTHAPFVHRGKTMLAVTGYPGSIFLIDAQTMALIKTIDLGVTEDIKLAHPPHICTKDSYGILPANDGERVFVAQSNKMSVLTVHDGKLETWWDKDAADADKWCFTGHMDACPPLNTDNAVPRGN